uniref:Uncharacterized protein n=2 Tax=Anguilla anguilla TaxID=7936 RepID=A0A0E9TAQ4_ANGAN
MLLFCNRSFPFAFFCKVGDQVISLILELKHLTFFFILLNFFLYFTYSFRQVGRKSACPN